MFARKAQKGYRVYGVLAALLTLLLLAQPIFAAEPAPVSPSATTADDGGAPEVGVEWVNDYPAGWGDLPGTDDDALGLRFQLGRAPLFFIPMTPAWTRSYAWGNTLAWEEDFKRAAAGGTEHIYLDTVDLAYFSGHGSSTGFYFGVGGNTHDDSQLHYNDCRLAWGDGDAEWVGISACNVLDDAHLGDWAWCMNRLHLILSMKTVMSDVAQGDWFGWYIRLGYNMTQAWFKAGDKLLPQGQILRVLAEEQFHFNDTQNNHIGGDWWDNDYFWWTHPAGSELARPVNIAALNGTMPVFATPPLSLDEANQRYDNLGSAFGVPVTGTFTLLASPAAPFENPIRTSADGQLEMDESSGLFVYTDMDQLWAGNSVTPTLSAPGAVHQITQDEAHAIADQFLNQNGLMAQGAQFYEVVADTQTEANVDRANSLSTPLIVNEENTVWQVVYSRIISYTVPPTGNSPAEEVAFSVIGPGAKLKVYVPTETTDLSAPAAENVIGGQGGWREIDNGNGLMAPVAEVDILSYNQIALLLNNLEDTVALSYVPLLFDSREVVTYTLAYYEHQLGTGQDQLIPTYALTVRYNLTGGGVITSPVYIPANPKYMAPFAKIVASSTIPDRVAPGTQIVFTAEDASKNLSDLGYDATLNFPLGTGDVDSYLYTWYLGSVDANNQIGTGRTLTYTVGKHGATNGEILVQQIILQVHDSTSPRPPSTTTDAVSLNVVPPTYVPLVNNN